MLDLLATARRWRMNEPFVAGQIDGLSRALVACLNADSEVPKWLRRELCAFLLDVLWERGRPTADEVRELTARWTEAAKP